MKINFLILSFFFMLSASTKDTHLDQYLQFLKKHKHLGEYGNYKEGNIEIVLEKKTIKEIEEAQAKRFMRLGESPREAHEHAKIGIVAKDRYWWWVRDAVLFPSGATGTFDRVIRTGSLTRRNNSVAIFPVTTDGKIVLNVMYRHAIRGWVLEIPRGKIEFGETNEGAAKRELREETGMVPSEMKYLGEIIPDSGTVSSIVPIYFARVSKQGPIAQDYSEAILGTITLSKSEIINGYTKGYLEVRINDKKCKAVLKDGYLSYALLLAQEKSLI